MSPYRVLVADDHARMRADVREALEQHGGFRVCAEARDAATAISAATREQPDICLLDVWMPGTCVAAAWEISGRLPETKIVMLTVSRADDDLFASLRAGAVAYLLKDADPATLPDTLLRVLAGESPIPPSLVARMVEQFRGSRLQRRRTVAGLNAGQPLTSREWEVLELLQAGLGTKRIAEQLVVSPSAVRSHIASILRKLRVPDRASALRLLDEHATERRA